MSSTIQNARAIQAALQRLQGPAARGRMLVKATGADQQLRPGACLSPKTGGSLDRLGLCFVRPNPANPDEDTGKRTWTVTNAGTYVDVETVSGGTPGNRDGGTTYVFDPPIDGIEPLAVLDPSGMTGGDWSGLFAGLQQFEHFHALDFDPKVGLFQSLTFNYPAAILQWANTTPLDGPMAGTPGPRTARTRQTQMLYRNTWHLYLATSRLDSFTDRSQEATTLRDDVMGVLTEARRVRERSFIVSAEPGLEVRDARPSRATPTIYVDWLTLDTIYVLERNPEAANYSPWMRSRMKLFTEPNPGVPPQPDAPPIENPNIIVSMPPDGPGPGPYP